jgi:serine/threonine protein kinase
MSKECINQINVGKKRSFTSFFGNIDSDALDLLNHLLVFNPKERYSAKQALEHPYMNDFHYP